MVAKSLQNLKVKNNRYKKFSAIDGRHPFQESVHGSFVPYKVRPKKRGRVTYLNFPLAKEMGLIDGNHPHQMNSQLEKELLDAFSIQIINEPLLWTKLIYHHISK